MKILFFWCYHDYLEILLLTLSSSWSEEKELSAKLLLLRFPPSLQKKEQKEGMGLFQACWILGKWSPPFQPVIVIQWNTEHNNQQVMC